MLLCPKPLLPHHCSTLTKPLCGCLWGWPCSMSIQTRNSLSKRSVKPYRMPEKISYTPKLSLKATAVSLKLRIVATAMRLNVYCSGPGLWLTRALSSLNAPISRHTSTSSMDQAQPGWALQCRIALKSSAESPVKIKTGGHLPRKSPRKTVKKPYLRGSV